MFILYQPSKKRSICFGGAVASSYSKMYQTHAGYFMAADRRIAIADRLKRVPMGFFNANSTGQLSGVCTTVVSSIESMVPMVLVNILGGMMLAAVALWIGGSMTLPKALMVLVMSFLVFSQISMVFQDVYLFADTIENNIKFGCPDASHEQVVEAARRACCDDFIEALPDGYKTVIGEGGASLSGGEKQRISIARALLKDAPIIILDEATANVDPENEDRLQKAIEALTHEKTVLMIAHRLKTVRNADQILVLDGGSIVQRGTHAELVARDGVYRDFIAGRQQAAGWKM